MLLRYSTWLKICSYHPFRDAAGNATQWPTNTRAVTQAIKWKDHTGCTGTRRRIVELCLRTDDLDSHDVGYPTSTSNGHWCSSFIHSAVKLKGFAMVSWAWWCVHVQKFKAPMMFHGSDSRSLHMVQKSLLHWWKVYHLSFHRSLSPSPKRYIAYSMIFQNTGWVLTKLGGWVGYVTRTSWLDFG